MRQKLSIGLLLGAMIGGSVFLIADCTAGRSAVNGAARSYLDALALGDLDGAYELLASETQRLVNRDAFADALDTPRFTSGERVRFHGTAVSSAGHACIRGSVSGQGFYIYLRQGTDMWRVHSITFEAYLQREPWRWCRSI